MNSKEPDARIRIEKMLIEAGWKLPGWSKDEEINVKTEIKNYFGEADYVLLSSKENHLCTVEAKKPTLSPLVGKEQARDYADALKSRFVILSNGIYHYLWDLKQGNPFRVEKFPSQEELEMRMDTFNPPRDEDEKDGINDDYLALAQFPKYKESPDYKNESKRSEFLKKNNLRFLRYYQVNAIAAIQQKIKNGGDRFLLEMATGTGKTYTAFGCINRLQNLHQRTAVIIACPQKHLIEQWKEELTKWNNLVEESDKVVIEQTVTCDSDYRWRDPFDKILHDYNDPPIGSSSYITNNIVIFTSHATLSAKDFRERISSLKDTKRFLIVDEVHNIGEEASKSTLLEEYDCRLGLSATPNRHMDDVGTGILKDYFHSSTCDAKNNGDADVCIDCNKELILYKLDLRKAIHELHVLCTYEYYPYYVELTSEEMEVYDDLTARIARAMEKKRKGQPLTDADKWAFLARGYLVQNAENKDRKLDEILTTEFNNKLNLTLIYCTSHPREDAPPDAPPDKSKLGLPSFIHPSSPPSSYSIHTPCFLLFL